MEEKKYLKFYNKAGYGGGDFAANMVYGLISSFVMIYLTNTIGMDAGIIGTLILLSKLLDGVTDILFGSLIDRTHSKFGKARPWMFWSYFGNAIALIALFSIPMNMSSKLQYAYFFIAYTLLNAIFYTANNIAYSALTSLITKNSQERVQMGTFRFIGSTLGNLLVSNYTLVLVEKFGGGNAGWRTTAIIFALIGLVVNTISVLSVKELPEEELNETYREAKKEGIEKKEIGLIETLKTLVSNKYFNMLTMIYLLFYLMTGVSMGAAIYYFTYNCGNAGYFGNMVTVFSAANVIGLIAAPVLVKKLKNIRLLNLGCFALNVIVRAIYMIFVMQANASVVVWMYGLVALTCCTLGGTFNALVSEASDYTYLNTGKRMDGSMYSCTSFGMKVGNGLGSAISGWLLAASHYDATAAVQSASCTNMLAFMFAGIPLIITVVIVFLYYKLDVEKVNQKLRSEK
ncbi:MFS transporter [Roseburia rectibacter]|jgi:GPH family glycoside/pentoside/hexuronide:cation symporter|uniref:MFS transporter n=1 Tax=Roseburia TaxID=841 RepID=UPI00164CD914|nr:MFS transporter [Roseburia rectibacter]UMZ00314.1 MFS transporter [Roseburia rectibacter]